MEQLGAQPTPRELVRLTITDDPKPQVLLELGDESLDVLPALEQATIEVSGAGIFLQLTLKVDLEFGFPVNEVTKVVGKDLLKGLTVDELDGVVANASANQSLGQTLLRHLRDRA